MVRHCTGEERAKQGLSVGWAPAVGSTRRLQASKHAAGASSSRCAASSSRRDPSSSSSGERLTRGAEAQVAHRVVARHVLSARVAHAHQGVPKQQVHQPHLGSRKQKGGGERIDAGRRACCLPERVERQPAPLTDARRRSSSTEHRRCSAVQRKLAPLATGAAAVATRARRRNRADHHSLKAGLAPLAKGGKSPYSRAARWARCRGCA